jgi:hypothetical protein
VVACFLDGSLEAVLGGIYSLIDEPSVLEVMGIAKHYLSERIYFLSHYSCTIEYCGCSSCCGLIGEG